MVDRVKSVRLAAVALMALAGLWVGCGSSNTSGFGDGGLGGNGPDGTTLGSTGGNRDSGIKLGGNDSGQGLCIPPSCADLNASCGPVTDVKCGGVVQCGTCKAGETCGAKKPNQCAIGTGGVDGGCTKKTCMSQGIGCGQAGDGCGGMLSCGTCSLPQICGGDPAKLGQCGCTGTCASVPTCGGDAGTTTTLSGKVYDPAGVNGLYNVLVYVPNNPSDPGLAPFTPGVTCDVCGATAAGDPLVTTYTAPDGTFTLSGVPVGSAIPLIIQLGRWRRQFTVPISTACSPNTVADKTLQMPANHTEGDIPFIAILSGSLDPVECVLRKIGIDDTEFVNPGSAGHVQFYTANDPNRPYPSQGSGAVINASTPGQAALFAATGGPSGTPEINNYDMTILECEGYPEVETANQPQIAAYAAAGGRVFASDYAYSWLNAGALSASADWNGDHSGGGYYSATGAIDQPPENPIGVQFQQWLEAANVAGAAADALAINPAFSNTTTVIAPTQQWLHDGSKPIHFTFNAPIGAAPANQCGRVTFSDWHAELNIFSNGTTFPSACPGGAMTAQEAILEFMLFDLSACVMPYTPVCTPTTCGAQGIQCGPAGDGCGNVLECGTCASGSCGGGGSGKCGTTVTCTPETCAKQGIQCGPAGDGCGNEIQCGNCPTGEICGLNTPGQCGIASSH